MREAERHASLVAFSAVAAGPVAVHASAHFKGRRLGPGKAPYWTFKSSARNDFVNVARRIPVGRIALERHYPVPSFYLAFDWCFDATVEWTHELRAGCLRDDGFESGGNDELHKCKDLQGDGHVLIKNPRSVLLTNQGWDIWTQHLLEALKKHNVPRKGDRVLAMTGTDRPLSERLAQVQRVMPWFTRIFYECYDIQFDGIWPLPIPLTSFYVMMQGPNNVLAAAARPWREKRRKDVMGAFGKVWHLEDRDSAAGVSRQEALKFCQRRQQAEWLTCELVDGRQWFQTLGEFRFLLNPTGNGIQSPKATEAMLSGVIPISQRLAKGAVRGGARHGVAAFDSLLKSGWPMVVVDHWEEVANQTNRDRWWAELSPKLRRMREGGAFTVEGWMRYLSGSLARPSPSADDLVGPHAAIGSEPYTPIAALRQMLRRVPPQPQSQQQPPPPPPPPSPAAAAAAAAARSANAGESHGESRIKALLSHPTPAKGAPSSAADIPDTHRRAPTSKLLSTLGLLMLGASLFSGGCALCFWLRARARRARPGLQAAPGRARRARRHGRRGMKSDRLATDDLEPNLEPSPTVQLV